MKSFIGLLWIFLGFFICHIESSLIVLSPTYLQGTYYANNFKYMGKQAPYNVSGTLVRAEPFSACSDLTNDVYNKIVLVSEGECSPGTKASNVAKAGASAVLIVYALDVGSYTMRYSRSESIQIPVVALKDHDFMDKSKQNEAVVFTVDSEPSEFENQGFWTAYTVTFEVFSFISLAIACNKLYHFVAGSGVQLSLPQITLSLEVISNIGRILLFVDPGPTGRGIFSYESYSILSTFSFAYTLSASLLISFYWREMLIKFRSKGLNQPTKFISLKTMRVPCILACIFVIGLEHTTSAVRATMSFTNTPVLVVITVMAYVALGIGCALFFLLNGIGVLRFLRQVLIPERSQILTRITILLVVASVGLITFVIGVVAFASVGHSATGYFASSFITYLGLSVTSAIQILTFIPWEHGSQNNSPSFRNKQGDEELADFASKRRTKMPPTPPEKFESPSADEADPLPTIADPVPTVTDVLPVPNHDATPNV